MVLVAVVVAAENGVLLFMKQVLQLRQGTASGGLTIKELNDLLDQLSSSENRFMVFALIGSSICYLCAMFVCLLLFLLCCCISYWGLDFLLYDVFSFEVLLEG